MISTFWRVSWFQYFSLQAKDVDDEDDDEYEAYEETALEGFNTIIDEDEYIEDEYVTFKHTLQSK